MGKERNEREENKMTTFKTITPSNAPYSYLLLFMFVFGLCFPPLASAQVDKKKEEKVPKGVVPPPLSLLSKDEKKQLESEPKIKKRTKLALQFMEGRIVQSENLIEKNNFQKALNQLGKFQALLRNTFKFLKNNKDNRKKNLKSLKKFEMTLRKFIPRLELVRRGMPFKYGYHVKQMIRNVNDTRSNSLESFFDDTVITEKKGNK